MRNKASVFVLAFVVEFEVGYNPFIYKTQLQKLFFIIFLSFFDGPTYKTPPQKQTPSNTKLYQKKPTLTHHGNRLG